MKKVTLVLLFTLCFSFIKAQLNGDFNGFVNGDNVVMSLSQSGSSVSGNMIDSKQTYTVSGTVSGNNFSGRAVEPTLGLTFLLSGIIKNNVLDINAKLDLQGQVMDAFTATFTKNTMEEVNTSIPTISLDKNAPSFLKSKSIDSRLVGTWREESHYSSGSGENYFSGSTYTYQTFFANHTMSEVSSTATMSGSNYSGSSSDANQGLKIVPNVWYYTEGNKMIAYIKNGANYQSAEMGSYYIENNKMMFTQANTGKKILYTKM